MQHLQKAVIKIPCTLKPSRRDFTILDLCDTLALTTACLSATTLARIAALMHFPVHEQSIELRRVIHDMGKATIGEGDCDHLSHLALCMKCNNLVKIITGYEFERRSSDAWTGSTNAD